MILTINGKDYELKFGLKFIAYLDNIYRMGSDTFNFGAGMNTVAVYLDALNPTVLMEIIKAGLVTSNIKPSEVEIEDFILSSDIEQLANDFFTQLKTQPATKIQILKFLEQAEAETNRIKSVQPAPTKTKKKI